MKKLNKTELEVIAKKIIGKLALDYRDEESAFLEKHANEISAWKERNILDIKNNPCLLDHFTETQQRDYLPKMAESLAIKQVKRNKGYIYKNTPFSSEVFNALILAQIECPDLETLIKKVSETFKGANGQ